MAAQRQCWPDGRWHFQHGPIDIVIGADGRAAALAAAHEAAWQRFASILDELVQELAALRARLGSVQAPLGRVARRMWQACRPYRAQFITPMAAVAGAVAEELIVHYRRAGVDRAWVNNGGDIALHLARGQSLAIGLYADLARLDAQQLAQGLRLDGRIALPASSPVRGLATSGWRGRSFSLGIADSVTVLAGSAAMADAAATVIANATNVDDPCIVRRPANQIADNSDLGAIAVTVDVPRLPAASVELALQRGARKARALRARGLIDSAVLVCQGRSQAVGTGAEPLAAAAPPIALHDGLERLP